MNISTEEKVSTGDIERLILEFLDEWDYSYYLDLVGEFSPKRPDQIRRAIGELLGKNLIARIGNQCYCKLSYIQMMN